MVQAYDLNYAGVIIGPDLRLDSANGRTVVDRMAFQFGASKDVSFSKRSANSVDAVKGES